MGLEIISIVLGVLLALAVSEWQESRNNLEHTEAALRQVQSELQNNLELLEFVHDKNIELINLLKQDSGSIDQDAQFLPALQIADSAWRTLGSTGLSGYVDFDLMVTLSQIFSRRISSACFSSSSILSQHLSTPIERRLLRPILGHHKL